MQVWPIALRPLSPSLKQTLSHKALWTDINSDKSTEAVMWAWVPDLPLQPVSW